MLQRDGRNQYVYESQMNANRIHAASLALDRNANIQDVDKIQKRLRDNPERADIYRGDALNVALDEINDPRVYAKALQGAKAKIGGQTIRNIPFQSRLRGDHDEHPPAHQGAAARLAPDAGIRSQTARRSRRLGQEVRKQIEDDKQPDRQTVEPAARGDPLRRRSKPTRSSPGSAATGHEADRYLKALHGLVAMLETPRTRHHPRWQPRSARTRPWASCSIS